MPVRSHLQRNFVSKRERSICGRRKRKSHLPSGHLVETNQCGHISDLWILSFEFEDLKLCPFGSNLHGIRPQSIADDRVPETKFETFSNESKTTLPSPEAEKPPSVGMPGPSGAGPWTTRIHQGLARTQPVRGVNSIWPSLTDGIRLMPTTRTSTRRVPIGVPVLIPSCLRMRLFATSHWTSITPVAILSASTAGSPCHHVHSRPSRPSTPVEASSTAR